ncbi:hypothetical protein ACFS7Z_19615 [Pontibacter toksunensis]|uniref:Uncharacterized protein n=1 Tax=Pontibacter toksunensis TaxID=1332631 RepID=A0ABW6BY36_9BACT
MSQAAATPCSLYVLIVTIMNLPDLYSELKKLGVGDNEIYLHGLYGSTDDNEKLSMTIKKGKYIAVWEVYFKERGEKHSIVEFNNESGACEYYLKSKENELRWIRK